MNARSRGRSEVRSEAAEFAACLTCLRMWSVFMVGVGLARRSGNGRLDAFLHGRLDETGNWMGAEAGP